MIRYNRSSVLIHVFGILAFLCLPLLFVSGGSGLFSILSNANFWLFGGLYIILFYVNTYVLIPRLYLPKKYWYYFTVIALLLALTWWFHPFDQLLHMQPQRPSPPPGMPPFISPGGPMRPPRQGGMPGFDIVSIFLFITTIALGIAIRLTRQWRETQQQVIRAEADKVQAELSFLKAQVNPHFLFNTLNNIYTLALTKNEKTADSIIKLSNIMRYVTDDVTNDFVPLQSEVDCITDYIELQRLRLSSKAQVQFSVTGDTASKQIAPLILMAFVENVFKYGISNHEQSDIIIQLLTGERSITFYTKNKILSKNTQSDRTGIGIANTKKRLDFLYPDKYVLHNGEDKEQYIVELVLLA